MRQAAERVGWAIGWVDRLLTAQAIIYLLPASAGHQKKWVHGHFPRHHWLPAIIFICCAATISSQR
jgi:hypothetical protein